MISATNEDMPDAETKGHGMWVWRSEMAPGTSDIWAQLGRMSKDKPDREEEIQKLGEQQKQMFRDKREL